MSESKPRGTGILPDCVTLRMPEELAKLLVALGELVSQQQDGDTYLEAFAQAIAIQNGGVSDDIQGRLRGHRNKARRAVAARNCVSSEGATEGASGADDASDEGEQVPFVDVTFTGAEVEFFQHLCDALLVDNDGVWEARKGALVALGTVWASLPAGIRLASEQILLDRLVVLYRLYAEQIVTEPSVLWVP